MNLNLEKETKTDLSLDTKKFLLESLELIIKDSHYAYPHGYFDSTRGHTTIQKMKSNVLVLESFVKNLS